MKDSFRLSLLAALLLAPLAALHAATPAGNPARSDQHTLNEAVLTAMERLNRGPGIQQAIERKKALAYLGNLATPVPPEVATALAVAQSDQDNSIRQAALLAGNALQLKLDVPALLLDALSSKQAAVRVGAVSGILELKLPPERIKSKVVDALMTDSRFARNDVKRLIVKMGKPLRALVIREIQTRYVKATDVCVKGALLRALGRDSVAARSRGLGQDYYVEEPMPEGLPLLSQALNDSSAEVRLAAVQTLRWLELPSAWVARKKNPPPNIFRDQPEVTAQIVKALQGIMQTDASVACRAEAVGCLAEMRQPPELLITMLGDKEAAVRTAAAQGLCNYERAKLQAAIPALQKLASDAECKADAAATLGYIQGEAAQTAMAGEKPLPSLNGLSPEKLLKENARLVERAAKLSLDLDAEHIPDMERQLCFYYSAQLCFGRNRMAANARLQQEMRFYCAGDLAGLSGTRLPLVYALHYSKSRYFPGGLTPETEDLFKQMMFSYVDWSSKVYFDECLQNVMNLPGTENQSLQYRYGLWFMELALLNEDPAYAARKLRSGKTVAQCYEQWNAYMKQWLRTHALNGIWIELGSHYSGGYSMPAILAISTAASDPETRQLIKMFLDLALVEDAQACYGAVRGGNRNRVKSNTIDSPFEGITDFLYNGEGGSHPLAVSGYRAPAVAVLLRNFEQYPPQPIVIANRRFGEVRGADADGTTEPNTAALPNKAKTAEDSEDAAPADTSKLVTDSKALNYVYKTRHYMIGSMLRDPKTRMHILYKNCPWNGILFADGKGLFPDCYSEYFSFQHGNVLILRSVESRAKTPPANVLISSELERVEESGWVFIKDGDAYAGIKILTGGHTWQKGGKGKGVGKYISLMPAVPTSPILIEAGDKDEFGSFDGFKATVQKNTITVSADKVEYSGPKQPRIEFYFESTGKASKVDGKAWSPDSVWVYSSPFMQRKEGESVVTVTVGGKRVLYDFANATITETDNKL